MLTKDSVPLRGYIFEVFCDWQPASKAKSSFWDKFVFGCKRTTKTDTFEKG